MTITSEVYIEGSEADPAVQAASTVRRAQRSLTGALRPKVALLTELKLGPEARERAQEALARLCDGPLRRYLDACDQTLYAAAADAPETRLLIRALRTSAAVLRRHLDALPNADEPPTVTSLAESIDAVFAAHLAIERTVLLPALAALPGVDLPALAADLETLLDGGTVQTPAVLDVRAISRGQRHPRVFARFARLAPGEAFTLVNNHDPKPLRRELQATYPGAVTWRYLESGPERWQVSIGRATAPAR
ncbi:DUF2249 domain-containing protein [Actinocrinis puniceicyclus]|uniref:DUF2249 domain-containing protein n=1 Tax=Actinocrinis puniceicyclus TaxID=977794 RepID=A0A8J7WML0_9ACTN|nr:DUF2249 domain-containing protein [Actinocrinis puniceicyclus]MBS2965158.1 DUF2249 domain-containing protein [Actinocrinis puniceicyclus]